MITKYLNGHEIYKKEVPIEYEMLLDYAATWDEIGDSDEIQNEYDDMD